MYIKLLVTLCVTKGVLLLLEIRGSPEPLMLLQPLTLVFTML